MKREILRIEAMTVTLQDKVCLKNVDFNVLEGELLAVTGPNNAGKTVLARAVAGMLPFSAGRIFRNEETVESPGAYSRTAGDVFYISRDSQLVGDFTVAENILGLQKHFPLSLFHSQAANRRAQAILDALGLTLSPTCRADSLAAAQQHLLTICRAVAGGAKIVILDGISTQYGPEDFQVLTALLGRLKGISVIYVSHDSDPILMLADRVVLIRGSTIAGVLYKGAFRPEILNWSLGTAVLSGKAHAVPAQSRPLLSTGLAVAGCGLRLDLLPGEVAVIQDQRDHVRRELMAHFLDPRPWDLWIQGRRMRSYRQAVRNGLAVLPERLSGNYLFDCLNESENLSFQILKKTSMAGLLNTRVCTYAQKKYADCLATDACRSNPAWRTYKLCLYRWQLANCKVMLLENPAAGMDGVILRELLSVLEDMAGQGMAVLIIANHYANYVPICTRVLDLEQGQEFRIVESRLSGPASDTPAEHC